MDFWSNLPNNFTCLAPMESVTDTIFRQVVAKAARPDVFFTEFTNVSSFASEKGRPNALERLIIVPTDSPIIAQLWGTNPDHFAYTAQHLPKGFSGIDINMGCPDKHVVKNGGGSALIKAPPEVSAELISAVKSSTSLPVSVKTRLGYSKVDEWRSWLTHLLEQDLAALTIHLRTKKEMSKSPAHHELIPEILELAQEVAPHTTIIFNGDFTTRTHFDQTLNDLLNLDEVERQRNPSLRRSRGERVIQSKIGCMIGRGVFTNPFCFEKSPRDHNREELMELLMYHLDLFDSYEAKLAPRKFEPLKRFFKIYINNFEGAADIRARLMTAKTTAEVRHIIAQV